MWVEAVKLSMELSKYQRRYNGTTHVKTVKTEDPTHFTRLRPILGSRASAATAALPALGSGLGGSAGAVPAAVNPHEREINTLV